MAACILREDTKQPRRGSTGTWLVTVAVAREVLEHYGCVTRELVLFLAMASGSDRAVTNVTFLLCFPMYSIQPLCCFVNTVQRVGGAGGGSLSRNLHQGAWTPVKRWCLPHLATCDTRDGAGPRKVSAGPRAHQHLGAGTTTATPLARLLPDGCDPSLSKTEPVASRTL